MFFISLLPLLLCARAASDPGRPSLAVDLPSYLSTSDLLWDWSAASSDPLAPTRWFQGAYIGNGLLGALVTCSEANGTTPSLRIDVGRTDLWVRAQRQPIGWLTVSPFASPLVRVRMRLVLSNATLLVDLTLANGDGVQFMLFINAADPAGPLGVLCLFVTTLTGGADPLILSWTPDTSGNFANTTVSRGAVSGNPWGTDIEYYTQGGARDASGDGGTYTTAFTNFNEDCGQTLILAVASDQRSPATWSSRAAAVAAVAAGVDATVEGLQGASSGWWADFWGGSWLSFDSNGGAPLVTALESFTHIANYRYASAARFAMHDLMGPWGPGGPGKYGTTYCLGPWCQYCWDMNQQVMLYLPTPANRGALLARPALDMLPSALNGSWYSIYGSNGPAGGTNLLWWLAAVARYCSHHGDDDRALAQLLPALRGMLSNSGLRNGTADGLLHVEGCISPEYPMHRANDCSYDLAIFHWAAETALALATAGDPSDPALPIYADIASRLAPLPIDSTTGSYEVAAGVPFAVPHRHYSHLLAVYDLGLNEPAATMAASLDVWWNITCAGPQAHGPDYMGDDECRGFTQAAMGAMSNRLNRTKGALGNLTSYLRLVGLPNGVRREPRKQRPPFARRPFLYNPPPTHTHNFYAHFRADVW